MTEITLKIKRPEDLELVMQWVKRLRIPYSKNVEQKNAPHLICRKRLILFWLTKMIPPLSVMLLNGNDKSAKTATCAPKYENY